MKKNKNTQIEGSIINFDLWVVNKMFLFTGRLMFAVRNLRYIYYHKNAIRCLDLCMLWLRYFSEVKNI